MQGQFAPHRTASEAHYLEEANRRKSMHHIKMVLRSRGAGQRDVVASALKKRQSLE